jgi:surface protein
MGNWCVGKVTDFSFLFSPVEGAILGFNEDISKWNTSSVTTMSNMFVNQNLFNQDLSRWDVSKVNSMSFMFNYASAFNQDISRWDVSRVTDISSMFSSASTFNQNISRWDVSKVVNVAYMFSSASSFNQSLCLWGDVLKSRYSILAKQSMFSGTKCIDKTDPGFDGEFITNLCHRCKSKTCFETRIELKEAIRKYRVGSATEKSEVKEKYGDPMGNWCVGKVTDFFELFDNSAGAPSGFNEDISRWNTSSVTNMKNLFTGQSSFNKDISRWDVSKVTVMTSMFFESDAFNQDISSWDVSKVTAMSYMFTYADSFNISLCPWKQRMRIGTGTYEMFYQTMCVDQKSPRVYGVGTQNMCHLCTS